MKMGKIRLFHKVIIGDEKDPYIIRWVLFGHPALPGVMVHKMIRSDHERALHDHPWNFVSLILKTGYEEQIESGDFVFNMPGHIIYRAAEHKHRVIIRFEPAWTLVFFGPRKRWWGFWVEQYDEFTRSNVKKWCHWKKYDQATAICSETNRVEFGEN